MTNEERNFSELKTDLWSIHRKLDGLKNDRGHAFIIIALIVLLLRGCS